MQINPNAFLSILLLCIVLLVAALVFLSRELRRRERTEKELRAIQDTLEQRVQSRAAYLQKLSEQRIFLAEVTTALDVSLDYKTALQTVADMIVPKLADWCLIDTSDRDRNKPYLVAAHIEPDKADLVKEMRRRYPLDTHSEADTFGQVLREGQSVLIPDVSETRLAALSVDSEHLAFLRALGAASIILVPITADKQILGTITLMISTSGRRYTLEDLNFATELAGRAGIAIEKAFLYEQAQQARRIAEQNAARIARYQLITSALSEAPTALQVIDVIINQGINMLGAVAGSVSMLSADGKRLEIVGANGYREEVIAQWQDLSVDAPALIAIAIRRQEAIWVGSPADAEAQYKLLITSDPSHQAWAAIPLTTDGQTIGAMGLSFAEPQPFSDDDKAFILTMAQKCAQALERANLYKEVSDQRSQLQVTLSSIGDAVIATDAVGRITFMNGVAEELTQWKNEEGIGHDLPEVFNIVSEATHEEVENPFVKVMRKGSVLGFANHTLLIARDRSEIPIDDSGAPIRDEQGQIKGVVLVFRDISKRRHQEEQLETTLQRTQDLYETCHQIGTVYEVIEVLRAQFNSRYLKHAEQACFVVFNDYGGEKTPSTYEVIARLKSEQATPGLTEDHLIENAPLFSLFSPKAAVFIDDIETDSRVDDTLRTLLGNNNVRSLIIYPLNARGQCFGLLAAYFTAPNHWTSQDYRHVETFIDQVSVALDNHHLLLEEKRARAEAERANEIRLKFLAMISHELRTPLTSIKGFASTLLATDVIWDAESQREFIGIINDEANKLTDLIEQLLDLSRLQAGMLRIHPEARPVSEIIDTARPQLETITANHHLVVDSDQNLPLVFADRQRIAQVLVNLVGNASKFSPTHTPITISFFRQPDTLQINVSDEGIGIAAKDRERAFAAFSQLVDPIGGPRENKGAGLGLAICKGLVEAHGGKIWIAERPGPGTTVIFTLPISTPKLLTEGGSGPQP
ncbi:MAG: GAF domain-containing protein [Aggregatilineales bacterium]